MNLSAEFEGEMPTDPIVVFEAAVPDLWITEADVSNSGDTMIAKAMMDYFGDGPLLLDRSTIRVNVITPGRVYEQLGC